MNSNIIGKEGTAFLSPFFQKNVYRYCASTKYSHVKITIFKKIDNQLLFFQNCLKSISRSYYEYCPKKTFPDFPDQRVKILGFMTTPIFLRQLFLDFVF